MLINLGTKIRTLRQRDGRTQEALADALGITPQAVSRWEANGSYPDVEMIPAIANYFHISIDELFGYRDDREERIADIIKKADKIISAQRSFSKGSPSQEIRDCVDMLRTASEEFPNEPRILLQLARALFILGYKEYGAMGRTEDGSNIITDDIEYNSKNIYWQEAMHTYEKVLKSNPSTYDRDTAICQVIGIYQRMGKYEKAEALAKSQDSMIVCRELLLTKTSRGAEQGRYMGEAIIDLLAELHAVTHAAVFRNTDVFSSEYGRQALESVANLYETIFSDGRCGVWHWNLATLYFDMAQSESNNGGDIDKAAAYFDKGFEHCMEYRRLCEEGIDEYTYSAPLVAGVKVRIMGGVNTIDRDYWRHEMKLMSQALQERLRRDEKYAECFEE